MKRLLMLAMLLCFSSVAYGQCENGICLFPRMATRVTSVEVQVNRGYVFGSAPIRSGARRVVVRTRRVASIPVRIARAFGARVFGCS